MRLHVARHPGADPVLLVHGFATTGALTWEATGWVAALAEAGRGAVVPDLRGHGGSDSPHDPAAYSPELLAQDLIAVLDEQDLDRVDVIGYSMGSWVALALVGLAPHRVRRLVVGGVGTVEQFGRWGVEAVQRAILGGADALPADNPLAPLLSSLREAPGVDREALAACAEGMAQHPLPLPSSVLPLPSSVLPPASSPLPLASSVPTLVVVGEVDPVAQGADEAAQLLGAELLVLPRRNHITTLSARAFKQAALPFLGASVSL